MGWIPFPCVELNVNSLVEVGLPLVKSAASATGSYLLKKVWSAVITNKCLVPGCIRKASMRKLCLICYSQAKQKVESGETTWEKLAVLGLCEKKEVNPFDDAYNRAMEDNEHASS